MPRGALVATVILALVGLAVSVALAIDYLGPVPAYCAEGGCATVRASAWSHPLGVPLPLIGAGFFAVTLGLAALAPRSTLRRAWAIAGGAAAIGFIAIQGVAIGAWCKLCLIVDGAALALAALALAAPLPAVVARRGRAALGALAAGALAAPIALAVLDPAAPPPAPVAVVALPAAVTGEPAAAEVDPDAVTIVEFVDFERPFCRALHGRLADAIAGAARPVRVVRKMVPLAAHPNAMTAALAWCSADALGRGDAMADALMAAPVHELTAEGCERLAARLGLDLEQYRALCKAPATRARIQADVAAAKAAGVRALPTVYIGSTRFTGAGASADQLAAAITGA